MRVYITCSPVRSGTTEKSNSNIESDFICGLVKVPNAIFSEIKEKQNCTYNVLEKAKKKKLLTFWVRVQCARGDVIFIFFANCHSIFSRFFFSFGQSENE